MKKFLLSTIGTFPLLCCGVFAAPVSFNLFQDGLSVLDKLLLCGIGIALIGVLFLLIAFLKPTSKKEDTLDSPFDAYLEPESQLDDSFVSEEEPKSVEESADFDDTIESDCAEEVDTEPEAEPKAEPEAEPEAEPKEEPEEEPVAEIETELEDSSDGEETEEDEIIYPKLILTNTQTNDFVILPLYPETTVGRRTENDLVLNDVTISGLHCKILSSDGIVSVLDENSTNGTFINGERITERTELHHGDKLLLGKQEFQVSINE